MKLQFDQMQKILNILRISAFIIVLITSIPLTINYFKGSEPEYEMITKLHVYVGIAFFIVAIASMIINKKHNNSNHAN